MNTIRIIVMNILRLNIIWLYLVVCPLFGCFNYKRNSESSIKLLLEENDKLNAVYSAHDWNALYGYYYKYWTEIQKTVSRNKSYFVRGYQELELGKFVELKTLSYIMDTLKYNNDSISVTAITKNIFDMYPNKMLDYRIRDTALHQWMFYNEKWYLVREFYTEEPDNSSFGADSLLNK